MQAEINNANPVTPVRIFGVNAVGHESGNDAFCQGRTLPWLQDTPQQNAWGTWQVTWRDVVILNKENRTIHVYNLTSHNLSNSAHYSELRTLLLDAAR